MFKVIVVLFLFPSPMRIHGRSDLGQFGLLEIELKVSVPDEDSRPS